MSVVDTAEIIKGIPLTDNEYLKAAVLGSGIQLVRPPSVSSFFAVLTRPLAGPSLLPHLGRHDGLFHHAPRQPCWYRVPKVGQIAINDSFMLEAAIYYLKKHFRGQSYYVDILEFFLETTFQTEMGQLIGLITAPEDEVDLSKFSLKKCVLFPLDVVLWFDHCMKAFTHCNVQNRVLLLLPPCRSRHVHVPRPPILPLRDANH